ncbi:MAG: CPBP family intramembrane metalloprotease, partial [Oscillospiraceae bacterium]|nr:CPBP family intramembrane metalloprotease [Oscillospiraceae bacterium]
MDYAVGYAPFLVMLPLLARKFPLIQSGQRSVRWSKPTVPQMISCFLFAIGVAYICTPTSIWLAVSEIKMIWLMPRFLLNTSFVGILSFSTFGTILIAPIVEEFIYRRLIQDRLVVWGEGIAIVLSAVFFSLVHMSAGRLLDTFLCGLVLGYVHAKTGTMRWNILLHMAVNALSVFLDCIPALYILIFAAVIYVPIYLIRRRPWRELLAGDSGLSAGAKAKACLTSVPFWVCVVFYMVLIVMFG